MLSCLATTRGEQLRWRRELEPTLAAEATGEGREWIYRNASNGTINGWRWPDPDNAGRIFLYARDLEMCGDGPGEKFTLLLDRIVDENENEEAYWVETDGAGVTVDVASGRWVLLHSNGSLEFEKRVGENVLLLVEPRYISRVHFYAPTRDAQRAAEVSYA